MISKKKKINNLINSSIFKNQLIDNKEQKEEFSIEKEGTYDDTTNILKFHKYILYKLSNVDNDIAELNERKNKYIDYIENKTYSINELKSLEKEIKSIDTKIENLKNKVLLKKYLEDVDDIIIQWKDYVNDLNIIKIGEKNEFNSNKLFLVCLYMSKAKKYDDSLNYVLRNPKKGNICCECFKGNLIDEEGITSCNNPECDYRTTTLSQETTYDDLCRVSSMTNTYQNKSIFISVMDRYQGKQEPKWDPKKYPNFGLSVMKEGIDKYCYENDINPKSINPHYMGKIFKIISKSNKDLPYNDFYDDLVLFTHLYNQWELPDLSSYTQLLIMDYDLYYQEYENNKHILERSSSQNAWLILYILIKRRKIPHKKENFRIPETESILTDSDKIARIVFKILEEKRLADNSDDIPWIYDNNI